MKRKASANKGQKKAGCFWCGNIKHFVKNCLQPGIAAAEELGFRVEGAHKGNVSLAMETE